MTPSSESQARSASTSLVAGEQLAFLPLQGGLTAAPKPRATIERFFQRSSSDGSGGAQQPEDVAPRLLPEAAASDRDGPAASGEQAHDPNRPLILPGWQPPRILLSHF